MAHRHPVYDTDKHFVIDTVSKRITTESPKVSLPQYSHKSERFTFEIPKEVEGHDMSLCNLVEIHFQNIDSENKENKGIGIYKVDDLKAEDEKVVFSWLVERESTWYSGILSFAIHFVCLSEDGESDYNLPTLSYSGITIGKTIWNSKAIANKYPNILAQYEARIQALENGGSGGSTKLREVVLLAENWQDGEEGQYYQVVDIEGVTEKSMVDLELNANQIIVMQDKVITFHAENEGGTVTIFATGNRPTLDYVVQVSITEVEE